MKAATRIAALAVALISPALIMSAASASTSPSASPSPSTQANSGYFHLGDETGHNSTGWLVTNGHNNALSTTTHSDQWQFINAQRWTNQFGVILTVYELYSYTGNGCANWANPYVVGSGCVTGDQRELWYNYNNGKGGYGLLNVYYATLYSAYGALSAYNGYNGSLTTVEAYASPPNGNQSWAEPAG